MSEKYNALKKISGSIVIISIPHKNGRTIQQGKLNVYSNGTFRVLVKLGCASIFIRSKMENVLTISNSNVGFPMIFLDDDE